MMIVEMKLPITIRPKSNPPIFQWKQTIDTIAGIHTVDHEGAMPPTFEASLVNLIQLTKQLMFDNAALQGQIDQLQKVSGSGTVPKKLSHK